MAKTIIGKVAVTPKGAYLANTVYEVLDIVSHEGSSYISLINDNDSALNVAESWMQIAAKGDAFVYRDFTDAEILLLQKASIDAAKIADKATSDLRALEGAVEKSEKNRVDSFNKIVTDSAVGNKTLSDTNTAVTIAEDNRVTVEEKRVSDELIRAETFNTIVVESNTVIAATEEAVTNVNASIAELLTEENVIKQSLIDPLQSRYTSVGFKQEDNTVSFSGELAEIWTDDFMLEFVADMTTREVFDILKLGSGGYYAPTGMQILGKYNGIDNRIFRVSFQKPIDNTIALFANSIYINKAKSEGKRSHVVISRSKLEAHAYINGVKFSVTHDRVLEISNIIRLANSPSFVHLRKFNFVDEDFALKLYNGGRWWENSIKNEYRGINSSNNYKFPSPMSAEGWVTTGDSKTTIEDGAIKVSIQKLAGNYNGMVYRRLGAFTASKRVRLRFKVKGAITDRVRVGLAYGPGNLFGVRGLNVTQEWVAYEWVLRNNYSQILDTIVAYPPHSSSEEGYFLIKDIEITEIGLQDEFLPSSLSKTGIWRNTATGSDLLATNNDQITYNTEDAVKKIISGEGAPDFAPDFEGQTHLDKTNKIKYTAFGTANAADWIPG